jgi:short-subunit dehydrogenase
VQAIEATLGPCELLIANAGGSLKGQREGSIDYEGTLATFRLNVDGVIHSLAAVVPGMEARKSGKIAIVSSVASLRGMPGFGGYGSAKAAISNFAEAMRIALAPKGISVTTIQPGFIKTPLTAKNKFPMPFMLEADEAARRIIRAIERKKAIYTFPFPMWLAYEIGIRIPVFIWDRMIRLGMPKDS